MINAVLGLGLGLAITNLSIPIIQSCLANETASQNNTTTDSSENSSKLETTINVKSYGNLKGDGSNEAKSIQSMFDKVREEYPNKPVIIKFPAGKYYSSEKITIYSNITITGVEGKTIFKNTKRAPFFINGKLGESYKGDAGSNITIKNITFNESRVMSIGHGKNIILDNLHVKNGPNNHAIEITGSKDIIIKNTTFEGMNLKDSSESLQGRDYNEFIQIDKAVRAAFPHFGSYNSSDYQTTNENITIDNCTFKKSDTCAFPVAIGTHGTFKDDKKGYKNIIIKNCTIDGATKGALRFPLVESIKIENNTIANTPVGFEYLNNSNQSVTQSLIIKGNNFKNVDKGIFIEKYKSSKLINKVEIVDNTFIGKKGNSDGTVAIQVKGAELIKSINNNNNKFNKFNNNVLITTTVAEVPTTPTKRAIIKTNSANIYKTTFLDSDVIATMKKGTAITVADTSFSTWKKTSVHGKTGFIRTHDISDIPSKDKKTQATIIAQKLNLRTGPSSEYPIIGSLSKGSTVTVETKSSNGWTKISYKNKIGYMYSAYLKASNSTTSPTPTPTKKNKAIITAQNLNLRISPNAKYSAIAVLPKGTVVTVEVASSNGWTKISYKDKIGYMASAYLKITKF